MAGLVSLKWLSTDQIVFATVIFGAGLLGPLAEYCAMAILSKKFVQNDIHTIPKWLGIIGLIFGLLSLLGGISWYSVVLGVIISPILQYFVAYWFLKNKFR